MKSERFYPLILMMLALCCFSLIPLLSGCKTSPKAGDSDHSSKASVESTLDAAKRMLKLDDYHEFEKAEFRFIAVRIWRMADVEVAGWLAQLYVAWADQLKSEISFLRLQYKAACEYCKEDEQKSLKSLVDYRAAKLEEVEENARLLCNMLRAYYPNHYLTHRVMADYFRIMGDHEKAEDRLLIVEDLNPGSVGLIFLKGAMMADFDKSYISAVAFYDKALERDPDFIKALYFKAMAYVKMGNDKLAKESMKEVLAKSPNHPGAKAYLSAESYVEQLKDTELKSKLKNAQIEEEVITTSEPHLIYWVGDWDQDFPRLLYRIAAPTENAAEVKVILSLVVNGDKVVQTFEQLDNLQPKTFKTVTQNFYPPQKRSWDTFEILIQLTAREPGEDEYTPISARRATLPIPQN